MDPLVLESSFCDGLDYQNSCNSWGKKQKPLNGSPSFDLNQQWGQAYNMSAIILDAYMNITCFKANKKRMRLGLCLFNCSCK